MQRALEASGLNAGSPVGSLSPDAAGILAGLQALLTQQRSAENGGEDRAEQVKHSWSELPKLPELGPESSLAFSDWLHMIAPLVEDMTATSAEYWALLKAETEEWYRTYLISDPMTRLHLHPSPSHALQAVRWSRLSKRLEALLMTAAPRPVREELVQGRVKTPLSLMCRLHVLYAPGGIQEREHAIRNLQHPIAATNPQSALEALRQWRRWLLRTQSLGGTVPDPVILVKSLLTIVRSVLEANSEVQFRVGLVKAALKADTAPNLEVVHQLYAALLSEVEALARTQTLKTKAQATAAAVSAQESQAPPRLPIPAGGKGAGKSDASPSRPSDQGIQVPSGACRFFVQGKGCNRGDSCRNAHNWQDIPSKERKSPEGLVSSCSGVRRLSLPEGPATEVSVPKAPVAAQPVAQGTPVTIATLQDHLDAIRQAIPGAAQTDQRPSINAITSNGLPQEASSEDECDDFQGPTGLLDSGATHAVRTRGNQDSDLAPTDVILAGGSTQALFQNRAGTHPTFGKLRVKIRQGCPVVTEARALQLIQQLEDERKRRALEGAEADLATQLSWLWAVTSSARGYTIPIAVHSARGRAFSKETWQRFLKWAKLREHQVLEDAVVATNCREGSLKEARSQKELRMAQLEVFISPSPQHASEEDLKRIDAALSKVLGGGQSREEGGEAPPQAAALATEEEMRRHVELFPEDPLEELARNLPEEEEEPSSKLDQVLEELKEPVPQVTLSEAHDKKGNGLAERIVGWSKQRTRCLLESSKLPQPILPGNLKPWDPWAQGRYLGPSLSVPDGHSVLKEDGNTTIVKNLRAELVDPEARLAEMQRERDLADVASDAAPSEPGLDLQLPEVLEAEGPPSSDPPLPRRVSSKRPPRIAALRERDLGEEEDEEEEDEEEDDEVSDTEATSERATLGAISEAQVSSLGQASSSSSSGFPSHIGPVTDPTLVRALARLGLEGKAVGLHNLGVHEVGDLNFIFRADLVEEGWTEHEATVFFHECGLIAPQQRPDNPRKASQVEGGVRPVGPTGEAMTLGAIARARARAREGGAPGGPEAPSEHGATAGSSEPPDPPYNPRVTRAILEQLPAAFYDEVTVNGPISRDLLSRVEEAAHDADLTCLPRDETYADNRFQGVLRTFKCNPNGVTPIVGRLMLRKVARWRKDTFGFVPLCEEPGTPPDLEQEATVMLQDEGGVPLREAERLVRYLPFEDPHPAIGKGNQEETTGGKAFYSGAMCRGGISALRHSCRVNPQVVRCLTSILRRAFPGAVFSSLAVFEDTKAEPHRDARNEDQPLDAKLRLHSTEPWSGSRVLLTGYTVDSAKQGYPIQLCKVEANPIPIPRALTEGSDGAQLLKDTGPTEEPQGYERTRSLIGQVLELNGAEFGIRDYRIGAYLGDQFFMVSCHVEPTNNEPSVADLERYSNVFHYADHRHRACYEGELSEWTSVNRPPPELHKVEVFTPDVEAKLKALGDNPLETTYTVSPAEARLHAEEWRTALSDEIESLLSKGAIRKVTGKEASELQRDPRSTLLHAKGVYTVKPGKHHSDGRPRQPFRRKARLVACGNESAYTDTADLYAAGVAGDILRASLLLAGREKWKAYGTDVHTAFLLAPLGTSRRYLLRPPAILRSLGLVQETEVWEVGKAIYGLRESPRWWTEYRDECLRKLRFQAPNPETGELEEHWLEQGATEGNIFKIRGPGNELRGLLVCYVDDFLMLSSGGIAASLHAALSSQLKWELDDLQEATAEAPLKFLGVGISPLKEGDGFALDQRAYLDEMLSRNEFSGRSSSVVCPKEMLEEGEPEDPEKGGFQHRLKQAQKATGELLWLAQKSRPDLGFIVQYMSTQTTRRPMHTIRIAERVCRYLQGTRDTILELRASSNDAVEIYTDASFAPNGGHSQGGVVIKFLGGTVMWKASKLPLIAISSAEAELQALSEGAVYGQSLQAALRDVSDEEHPLTLRFNKEAVKVQSLKVSETSCAEALSKWLTTFIAFAQ
ncbi:TY5A, partial [Symbiodinium sp. CCMP2456]